LFLLPLALFNPSDSLTWSGIRPGDILSWSLVALMLIIVADVEEIKLAAQFGQEFDDYVALTPFLIPKVSLFRLGKKLSSLERGKPMRYILWFVIYWSIMSLILYLFTLVQLSWTR
jgi:hypothetical protein